MLSINTINMLELPDKYSLIRNESDSNKWGIKYSGAKKDIVIVEPECRVCTVFKALGKILIAYTTEGDDGEEYFVIRNRKGDLEIKEKVYDFVASNKALYCHIKTDRGLELANYDKNLRVVKTFGKLTFDDHYTLNGNRVIPNTRQTLDVRDSDGNLCRINLIENTLEDVISFAKSARVNSGTDTGEPEFKIDYYDYKLNITKSTITRMSTLQNVGIATVSDIGEYLGELSILMGVSPTMKEEEVQVKRHKELYRTYEFANVSVERADLIDSILKSIPSFGSFDLIAKLLRLHNNNIEDVYRTLSEGFTKVIEDSFNGYSFKMLTTSDEEYMLIKKGNNKVYCLSEPLSEGMIESSEYEVVDFDVHFTELDSESQSKIPKPLQHKDKKESMYQRMIGVSLELDSIDVEEAPRIERKVVIFDRFSYGPGLKEKGSTKHKYSSDSIVLTTTTNDACCMYI